MTEIGTLTLFERVALAHDWRGTLARPDQLVPDGAWRVWLCLAGRGWGKTRTGAEAVRGWVESGAAGRIALVGRTAADVRDTMIEGECGLLAISPPYNRPRYEPSKRRLTWPNGAVATSYSADEPNLLRGPQHDKAWADELAAWADPDAWDQLLLGLRLGVAPQVVATTTPRPTLLIRQLVADARTVVTRGRTMDNAANLSPDFVRDVHSRYAGTPLGRQELDGEILEDGQRPYPPALIQGCHEDSLLVGDFDAVARHKVAVWGWDLAKAANETVGFALDAYGRVVWAERWVQRDWGWQIREIQRLLGRTPAVLDASGVGDPVVEALGAAGCNVTPFKFTSASRQPVLERLAVALSQRQVRGPFGTGLRWVADQLEAMAFDYTALGVRYTAPETVHDDAVMALALAVYGYDRVGPVVQAVDIPPNPLSDPNRWQSYVGADDRDGGGWSYGTGGSLGVGF